MKKEALVTTLAVRDAREGSYTMKYITVCVMGESALADKIDGCIDNKARYGTDEYAKRALDRYRELESMGATAVYEPTFSSGTLSFTLKWQLFRDEGGVKEWCEVSYVDLGRRMEAIDKAVKFVKRVARRIAKEEGRDIYGNAVEWAMNDPERFIEAVSSMKGVVRVCHYDTHVGDLSHETIRMDEARGHEAAA